MLIRELMMKLGLAVDSAAFAEGELAADALKSALEKIVEVAKEVVEAIAENIHAVSEQSAKIVELAQVTGIGTQSLQRLAKAASIEGIGLDEFSHSIVLLSRTLGAAQAGNDEAIKSFTKAGIAYKESGGKLRPTEDVFIDIADHFSNMQDGAEKTALALRLFGRSGAELIPVLNQGREELESYMQAQVMSPEQLAAGHEIIVIQRQLVGVTKALWRDAIGPLLPTIRDLYKRYLDWRKANAEIIKQKIRQFVELLITGVKGLIEVFEIVSNVIEVMRTHMVATSIILGGLVAAFVAVQGAAIAAAVESAAAWVIAAAPFAAIAAAIAALLLLYDDFAVYQKGKGRSAFGAFNNAILRWIQPQANDPWFVKALKEFVAYMEYASKALSDFAKDMEAKFDIIDRYAKYLPPIALLMPEHELQRNDTGRVDFSRSGTPLFGPSSTPGQGATPSDHGPWAQSRPPQAPDDFDFGSYGAGAMSSPQARSMTPTMPTPMYRPSSSQTSTSTTTFAPVLNSNVVVNQQPGENGPEFAQRVKGLISDEFQSVFQAAAANRKKR